LRWLYAIASEDMNQFVLPRLMPRDRLIQRITAFLSALPQDKAWQLTISVFRKTRSNRQNRALWGVAYKVLSDATGNDPEDLHEYFLGEWGGWDVIDVLGRKRRVPIRRSKKLSTLEFTDFYAFIQRRSAETVGVYVPDPDPDYWRHQEAA
jgi:hypothetical protein